jgi:hypothetical protein
MSNSILTSSLAGGNLFPNISQFVGFVLRHEETGALRCRDCERYNWRAAAQSLR